MNPPSPPGRRPPQPQMPRRQLLDPDPSGRHDILVSSQVLTSDSVEETKLSNTSKAAHCVDTSHPRVRLQIPQRCRATIISPEDLATLRNQLAYSSADPRPCRQAGTGVFSRSPPRLVVPTARSPKPPKSRIPTGQFCRDQHRHIDQPRSFDEGKPESSRQNDKGQTAEGSWSST